eukprot:1809362-Alexandrium_andersonii.AAC.1
MGSSLNHPIKGPSESRCPQLKSCATRIAVRQCGRANGDEQTAPSTTPATLRSGAARRLTPNTSASHKGATPGKATER